MRGLPQAIPLGANRAWPGWWAVVPFGGLATGLLLSAAAAWSPHDQLRLIADDAFFFVRYAYNFVHGGAYAWNSGGPTTFGSTSQLYQLVLTPLVAALPDREVMAAVWLPRIAGLLAVACLAWTTAKTY